MGKISIEARIDKGLAELRKQIAKQNNITMTDVDRIITREIRGKLRIKREDIVF